MSHPKVWLRIIVVQGKASLDCAGANMLGLWSILLAKCLPILLLYNSSGTSVLPAADLTLGKSELLRKTRFYLIELVGCLGKQTCSPAGLGRHCGIEPLLATLQASQEEGCKGAGSAQLTPELTSVSFLFHTPDISHSLLTWYQNLFEKDEEFKKQNTPCKLNKTMNTDFSIYTTNDKIGTMITQYK